MVWKIKRFQKYLIELVNFSTLTQTTNESTQFFAFSRTFYFCKSEKYLIDWWHKRYACSRYVCHQCSKYEGSCARFTHFKMLFISFFSSVCVCIVCCTKSMWYEYGKNDANMKLSLWKRLRSFLIVCAIFFFAIGYFILVCGLKIRMSPNITGKGAHLTATKHYLDWLK